MDVTSDSASAMLSTPEASAPGMHSNRTWDVFSHFGD